MYLTSRSWIALLVFIFVAVTTQVCLSAERTDFIISTPSGGEKWYPKTTIDITWTASRDFKATLNPKNPRKVHLIARGLDTPNFAVKENVLLNKDGSGRVTWTIPSNILPGRYQIQVINADGKYASGYSRIFTILPPPITSLKFTSPESGDTWYKGKTYTISWNYSDKNFKNTVTLQLIGERGFTIVPLYPNDGFKGSNSYQFTVPKDMPDGEYYIIAHYSSIRERSGTFKITDYQKKPHPTRMTNKKS